MATPFQDPAGSGNWVVTATDRAADKMHKFYVKAIADGGAFIISTEMTLFVECAPEGFTVTQSLAFVSAKTLYVSESKTDVYPIIDPEISLSYCTVESIELID